MNHWTDAHCHLQDEYRAGDDREGLTGALGRAAAAGVRRIVVIGTDAETSAQAIELAGTRAGIELFATVGLHPHEAQSGTGPTLELARANAHRIVGIGECGLDYFYEHSPRGDQRRAFAEQIGLAHELHRALVVHARDAWDDLFSLLASEGVPERTVIHCFTGGPDEADRCLALGCDLSFSGIVTFKNAVPVRLAAAATPLERLHVETDAPFLAPVPHRGEPNEPGYVATVGEFLAELLGVPVADLAAATWANTARLFGLPPYPG